MTGSSLIIYIYIYIIIYIIYRYIYIYTYTQYIPIVPISDGLMPIKITQSVHTSMILPLYDMMENDLDSETTSQSDRNTSPQLTYLGSAANATYNYRVPNKSDEY